MAQTQPTKKAGPDTESASFKKMKPLWLMINALLGGTAAMREAGQELLPKHRREFDDDYKERLGTNVLVNFFEWTLDGLVSKPFSEAPKYDNLPNGWEGGWLDDIDLQGNHITVFLRNWFRDAYAKGFAHVLIDFPRVQAREDGRPRTLDDDRKEGLRPYWVQVAPENVLFAHSETVNGVERLTQVRILEEETEVTEWEETVVRRIRVLRPGSVQLYRQGTDKKWKLEDEWATGLDAIPFVTYYAGTREGLHLAKPPLLDLAYLNVAHWQSSSDQRNVLKVARFPLLAGSGLSSEDADALVVGPNRLLTTTDPQGKFYYVEHTGAAINAGQKDLEALEDQMSGYGATHLKAQPGTQTATARALDSAEAISPLQAAVLDFEDAVVQALDWTAAWAKLEQGGDVEFNKEFGLTLGDQTGLEILRKTRETKDISRKAWLEELKRRGLLRPEYDAEEDAQEIEDEAANGLPELDLDPAQDRKDPDDDAPENLPPSNQPPAPAPAGGAE